MARQSNQPTSTVEETEMLDRLYNRQPRSANGRFVPKAAPASAPLAWTNCDGPTQEAIMRVPAIQFPPAKPKNALDADEPIALEPPSKMSRQEKIVFGFFSVAAAVLVVIAMMGN